MSKCADECKAQKRQRKIEKAISKLNKLVGDKDEEIIGGISFGFDEQVTISNRIETGRWIRYTTARK